MIKESTKAEFSKCCPMCDSIQIYSNLGNLREAEKLNSKCIPCRGIVQSRGALYKEFQRIEHIKRCKAFIRKAARFEDNVDLLIKHLIMKGDKIFAKH